MTNWQKNVIVAVSFQDKEEKKHILKVERKKDLGETLSSSDILTRNEVIMLIESGERFITAYKTSEGKWKTGEDVHVIHFNYGKFIRTDNNSKSEDNLGNLPEF